MILLPVLIIGLTIALSIPLGRYLARVLDRGGPHEPRRAVDRHRPADVEAVLSARCCCSTSLIFLFGFVVLATQPWHPDFLNPDGKGMLSPTTIFNTATLVPDQHEPAALLGRGPPVVLQPDLRDHVQAVRHAGDRAGGACWRSSAGSAATGTWATSTSTCGAALVYVLLPLSAIVAVLLIAGGMPMTFEGNAEAQTVQVAAMGTNDDGTAKPQVDRPRAGGGHRRHQATRHQRRRVLRPELGPPVREPRLVDQLRRVRLHHPDPDGLHGDVRADDPQHAARGRDLRRLAGHARDVRRVGASTTTRRSRTPAWPAARRSSTRRASRTRSPPWTRTGSRSRRRCRTTPPASVSRCRWTQDSGQPRRQGAAVRPRGRADLGGLTTVHLERLGELHARQPEPARRA